MQMAEGLDTGDVLREASVPIDATTTTTGLHDTLAAIGADAILATLEDLAAGRLQPRAQDAADVTYAAKLDKAEGRVDWQADAALVDRRIRAYTPWPGAAAQLDGDAVKLLRSRLLDADGTHAPPGTLLGLDGDWLRVACGRGVVGIGELQRAGRKRVSARDFANAELRGASGDSPRRFT
jgi:methionyl-tRNA formyltransferase